MFRTSFSKGLLTVTALTLSLGAMTSARADILFSATPNFVQPSENIQFNGAGTISGPAMTVSGRTNQTQTLVTFTGDEDLVTPAQGQARVQGADGIFSNLFVDLGDPGLSFTQFESNVNLVSSGLVTVTVTEMNGQVNIFTFNGVAGGQNFFGLNAILGQQINTVNINAIGNLDAIGDVRQIRIGGINRGGMAPVPEPGVVAFAAVNGLGVLGLMVRARRRKLSA